MSERVWNPHTSVLVCGVENGVITPNGAGSQRFSDLKEAQSVFPDLNPKENTQRFTWAIGNPQTDVMRFETWAAYNALSQ